MKRILFTILFAPFSIWLMAATYTPSTVPDPKQQGQDWYVSNPDGIIGDDDVEFINACAKALEDSTDVELAVVVMGSIGDYEPFDFGFELFQRWGIGKKGKNTGVLITFALESRTVYINTGTGIEGVLPDAFCSDVIYQKMIPLFKEEDYGGGLCAGVVAIYERCTSGNCPEELMNMTSVTRRGGFVPMYNDSAEEPDIRWWAMVLAILLIVGFTSGVLLLIMVPILIQGRKQTSANEYIQRTKHRDALVIICIFWPFAIPAVVWYLHRAKRCRCPQCGKHQAVMTGYEVIKYPTCYSKGEAEVTFCCKACAYEFIEKGVLPRERRSLGGGVGGGSGWSGGGGYSGGGGSWGGGSSSGGGAGGSW